MRYLGLLFALVCLLGASVPVRADIEDELQLQLQQIVQAVSDAQTKLVAGQDVGASVLKLHQSAEELKVLQLLLDERFAARQQQANDLGAEIAARQQQLGERLRQSLSQIQDEIQRLDSLPALKAGDLLPLADLLETFLPASQAPLLGSLPYRHLALPAVSPKQQPAVLPAWSGGNTTTSDADLHGTGQTAITPEIAKLAESLHWNPVEIYQWMQANVASEWYWGAMKGAAETLRQKSGNDADQASLLIALLRAAGFPARYVRGTVEYSDNFARLQNLLGLDEGAQVASFLQKAGVPVEPLIVGGKIAGMRFEHIWVETFVPYSNYRGVVLDEQGKIWLPLDTHLKPEGYLVTPAANPLPLTILDGLRDNYLSQSRDSDLLDFLHQRYTDVTSSPWADALRQRTQQTAPLDLLPASLQFKVGNLTFEGAELSDELVQKVTFFAGTQDGNELFRLTLPVAEVSNRQVTLGYEPESVADQETIDAHGGLSNTPAYLVHLRPSLSIDGEHRVVASDGLAMGDDYQLTVIFDGPHARSARTARHIAGNLVVLGIAAQQALPPAERPQEEQDAAWLMQGTALRYVQRWNAAEDELSAALDLAIARPLPTLVTVGGVLDVARLLDVPRELTWKGLFMDAGLRSVEVVAQTGQTGAEVDFMRLSALQGSVLEKQVFVDEYQVDAVSTSGVLGQANAAAQPLLRLDASNGVDLLPTLNLPENVRADIEAALHQGQTVTLPQTQSHLKLWSGYGYLKENPQSGEAGYMLSGVLAGGTTIEEWAQNYRTNLLRAPLAEPPNTDALAAAHIVKIPVSDLQCGTVGQQLEQPLAVLVTDLKGRPVAGAAVTLTHSVGLDRTDAVTTPVTYTASTDSLGIARFKPVLGKHTGANPRFLKIDQNDEFVTQVGLNLFDAKVESRYGKLSLLQPFGVYGRPDAPSQMLKLLGDKNVSSVNSPGGSLALKITDRYDNPVSNVPVTFEAQDASKLNGDLPAGFRNIELYEQGSCSGAYPLWEECKDVVSPSLTVNSAWHGVHVETMLGNTMHTEYEVKASVEGISSVTFSLKSGGDYSLDAYYPPTLLVRHMDLVDYSGQNINAARIGKTLKTPLQEALIYSEGGYSMVGPRTCAGPGGEYPCWDLKGNGLVESRKVTDGRVTFSPQMGEVSEAQVNAKDLYQVEYTAGQQPGLDKVTTQGEVQVSVPVITGQVFDGSILDIDTQGYRSNPLPRKTVKLVSGMIALFQPGGEELVYTMLYQKEIIPIYDVDVSTTVDPQLILLGDGGLARQDVTIDYAIKPQGTGEVGYAAQDVQVDLWAGECRNSDTATAESSNDTWSGYLVGSVKQGAGDAIFKRGASFDPTEQYCAQVVLNRGSDAEIRGDKVKLQTLYADLDIDSDNNAGWQEDGTQNPPSRNFLEDQAEALPGLPGKVLQVNMFDTDGDSVPGYADGFAPDKLKRGADGASKPFYPLFGEISGSALNPASATVTFDYSGSDPAAITPVKASDGKVIYPLPPNGGAMRLWTKDGQFGRKAADIAEGGDYITPGKAYPLSLFLDGMGLFAEGIRGLTSDDEKKITLRIDPDGTGTLPTVEGDQVFATPVFAALVPDYDHNRVIDEKDRQRAAKGDTYYFWINDDDDEGETEGSDIPGDTSLLGSLDYESPTVDGVRDLIDFFPVAFELKPLANIFPQPQFKYRLRADDEQVNLMFPELNVSTEGNYLTDVATARNLAEKVAKKVGKNGEFPMSFDQALGKTFQQRFNEIVAQSATEDDQPVLLFEGNKSSVKPLVLDILNESGQKVFSVQLSLSLAGVEQMFRHKNLIKTMFNNREYFSVLKAYPPDTGGDDRLINGGAPKGFTDPDHFSGFDETTSDQNFILIHGYNVNAQDSRGFQAEVFKRLYWSGMKAKLWAITWYGWESQSETQVWGKRSPNYHINVRHAYNAGKMLKDFVTEQQITSPTVAAHSLGNMVASTAIEKGMPYSNYIMQDAAVALEAFNGAETESVDMYHPNWTYPDGDSSLGIDQGYPKWLWASEWYTLFEDDRADLTWRDFFPKVRRDAKTYNFYSPSDEVFVPFKPVGDNGLINTPDATDVNLADRLRVGKSSWALQELLKGIPSVIDTDSDYGGWGFNNEDYPAVTTPDPFGYETTYFTWPPVDTSSIVREDLKERPFFKKDPTKSNLFSRVTNSVTEAWKIELLANQIPALTQAAGGNSSIAFLGNHNRNLPEKYVDADEWPRGISKEWLHSDFVNVAYVYLSNLYLDWVKIMNGEALGQ